MNVTPIDKTNNRILITGGAGFIGSHAAKNFIQKGYSVTIIDNLSNGTIKNVPDEAFFIEADISKEETYSKLKNNNFCAVLHFAAQSSGALSFTNPIGDLNSHVIATFLLLEWCKQNNINRFIYISSSTTYGNPDKLPVDEDHSQSPKTYYAAGKKASEMYVRFYKQFGLQNTIIRLPNVYGPNQNLSNKNQGMISIYLSYILENKPITVKGDLERFRDFIYIDDVVSAIELILHNSNSYGKTYNVSTGQKTTVKQVLDYLISAFEYSDYPIEMDEGTKGDQYGMICNNKKIQDDIGWQPNINIKDGIFKTVIFEKGKYKNGKNK